MFSPFPEGSRVIFYGDSITRLGGGVLRVAAQYRALFPNRDVRFVNAGISGGGLPDAALLASGEDDFMPDRVHPVEHGQWRLAENLLAAQGLPIAPFRSREETAEAAGLAEWDERSQRVANILSAERTFVHDETLDIPSRMAKVRAWLDANENAPGVLPVLIRFARDYLRDKPWEDELRVSIAAVAPRAWAWGCVGDRPSELNDAE